MLTEQQRIERRLGIGGSDMPIILGLSNYKTPYQLYMEKVSDDLPTDAFTEQQYWGHQLEGIISDEFAKRNQVSVEKPGTIIHPNYPCLRGNVDGYIPAWNAILEVKCSNQFMASEWGSEGTDVIPMQYLVQVAFYCMIANADCAYIAVLIGGNQYRQFKYTRDLELEDMLKTRALAFWDLVLRREPPEPINQVDLRLMFPKHNPEKTKTINKPLLQQLTTLTETRYKIKELSGIEEQYKFNIMQFMEDAECLVNESGEPIVSWKANKRGSRTFLLKGVN